jgi:hypothetical protein
LVVWLICSPGVGHERRVGAARSGERGDGINEGGLQVEHLLVGLYSQDGGGLAGRAPMFGVGDPGDVVAQRGGVGCCQRLLDRGVHGVDVCGDQVALQHGDVGQMRVIQSEPGGDAQRHPPVDFPGPLDTGVVGLDQDVNSGQRTHLAASFP